MLHAAARTANVAAARLIIPHCAVDAQEENGNTPAHIAGYTESADFLDYTTSLNFASDRFAKGLEIRGFAPTNPP